MSDAFVYRPKFVDIRVKPEAVGSAGAPRAEPLMTKRANATAIMWDANAAGVHRAPKSRDHGNEFWHFCARARRRL